MGGGLGRGCDGLAFLPFRRAKQDIIGSIRVERRIEIYQVNALGRDAIAENLEVIAVVERLHDVPVRVEVCSVCNRFIHVLCDCHQSN